MREIVCYCLQTDHFPSCGYFAVDTKSCTLPLICVMSSLCSYFFTAIALMALLHVVLLFHAKMFSAKVLCDNNGS